MPWKSVLHQGTHEILGCSVQNAIEATDKQGRRLAEWSDNLLRTPVKSTPVFLLPLKLWIIHSIFHSSPSLKWGNNFFLQGTLEVFAVGIGVGTFQY